MNTLISILTLGYKHLMNHYAVVLLKLKLYGSTIIFQVCFRYQNELSHCRSMLSWFGAIC